MSVTDRRMGDLGSHIPLSAGSQLPCRETAGLAIQATTGLHSLPIQPWAGLGVLAAWAAAALIIGGVLFWLRDA